MFESTFLDSLSALAISEGNYELAADYCEQRLRVNQERGSRGGEAWCFLQLGQIDLAQGDYDRSKKRFEEALEIFNAVKSPWGRMPTLLSLGRALHRLGDDAAAHDHCEQSLKPRRFDEEIKQSGAKTVLFMTWAWKSVPDMIEPVAEVYNDTGAELGAIVAPAGRAWQLAVRLKPELSLYYTDSIHTNGVGMYLTACVFYTVLTGKSPIGLSGREAQPFSGSLLRVSDEDARFLQQIAFETVAEFAPETIQVAVSPKGRRTTMWEEIKMSKSANGF